MDGIGIRIGILDSWCCSTSGDLVSPDSSSSSALVADGGHFGRFLLHVFLIGQELHLANPLASLQIVVEDAGNTIWYIQFIDILVADI